MVGTCIRVEGRNEMFNVERERAPSVPLCRWFSEDLTSFLIGTESFECYYSEGKLEASVFSRDRKSVV